MIAALLVTGAAGCSSDGSDSDGGDTETTVAPSDDTTTTDDGGTETTAAETDDGGTATTEAETDDGASGSGGTTSENADVQEYCDAVDEFVANAQDAMGDPDKVQEISEEGSELTARASELATSGLSSEDAQAIADCTSEATSALMPG